MHNPSDIIEAFFLVNEKTALPENTCLNLLSLDLTESNISMAKRTCSKPLHNLFSDAFNEPYKGVKNC